MMGRTHLVAGAVMGVGFVGYVKWLGSLQDVRVTDSRLFNQLNFLNLEWVNTGVDWFFAQMSSFYQWMVPSGEQLVWYLPVAIALYLVGSILPDIDNSNSLLGRYMPFSVGPHRGITHSDWILLGLFPLFLIPGLRVVFFLWLGILSHFILDGWSRAGRVRFWPLGRWKTISQGDGEAVVVLNSRAITYTVGSVSELVFAGIFIVLGVVGIVLGFG